MDATDAVALTAAILSAIVSLGTAAWARVIQRESSKAATDLEILRGELQQERDEATRELTEATARAVYRDPLLLAAQDLDHRLRNIQEVGFLSYLESERGETAVQTTLYRLARYFAALEVIGSDLAVLRLGSADATNRAARAIADVGIAFAFDGYDVVSANGEPTSRFMIWREEQRAMGEMCLEPAGERRRLVGYSAFVARLQGDARQWFARFEAELRSGGAEKSERLRAIRPALGELTTCLRADDASLPGG